MEVYFDNSATTRPYDEVIDEIFDVRFRSSQMSLAHISQEFY